MTGNGKSLFIYDHDPLNNLDLLLIFMKNLVNPARTPRRITNSTRTPHLMAIVVEVFGIPPKQTLQAEAVDTFNPNITNIKNIFFIVFKIKELFLIFL